METQPKEQEERLFKAVEMVGGVAAASKILDCTTQAIYAWKSGRKPFRTTLRKLADAAGVTVEWLSGDDSPRLAEEAPQYGAAFSVPVESRAEFARFAAHYGMSEGDAFRLIFDAFTGRIRKQF